MQKTNCTKLKQGTAVGLTAAAVMFSSACINRSAREPIMANANETSQAMDNAVDSLMVGLRSHDPKAREPAVNALVAIGKPAVPALMKVLGDEDYIVRGSAALALGEIVLKHPEYDWSSALPLLTKGLGDMEWWVREKSSNAIWNLADKHPEYDWSAAIPPLIKALGDRAPEVCGTVAEVLAAIGKQAFPAMVKALGDGDMDVRMMALEAFQAAIEKYPEYNWMSLVPVLSARLGDLPGVAKDATEALGKIAILHPENDWKFIIPGTISALGYPFGRMWAPKALGEIAGKHPDYDLKPAVPGLIKALGDMHVDVEEGACFALSEIGMPAVPELTKALGDDDPIVRTGARSALDKIAEKHPEYKIQPSNAQVPR